MCVFVDVYMCVCVGTYIIMHMKICICALVV
jgi:hypothetical protein